MTEHIQVAARIRPPLQQGMRCVEADTGTGRIVITSGDNKKTSFECTAVFNESSSQELVYSETAKHVVDGFVAGINGTVFAYGQTGSGKTYTMIGPDMDKPCRGVVPRAIKFVFNCLDDQLKKIWDKFDCTTRISFLELYNERIYDLLSNGKAIAYRDIYNHEVDVRNSEQCLRVISNGRSGRYTAPTTKNIESSRSHAIITLFLRTKLDEDGIVQQRESRLHLVDLAGSEFQSETYTGGYRLHEACDADKSLNTLCQVIRFLSATNPPPSYINFHDSLLTRMLKDALGGNSRTSVIVNLHSMDAYYDDSMSTLRFAQNVRKIKNTARVNENVCGVSAEVLQAKIVELNVKLRASEEACKQAESRVGRSSVENTQDGECEKFESMKAQFSTMVQELKSQLNQAELKISMLQLSNTFLVDLKSDVINADEVVKLMNQKYNEAVEEWKRTVSENAIANATDVELLRYNEAVTRLQRELAKKTEQFNAKYLEFEKLNAKVLEIRPLFKYDELQPPLSPVPGQEPVKCEDAGDAFYRKKYKELKIENVQLNQIICENKRVIENLNASVAEDLERYALKLFDAQAKVEQHQTTIKTKNSKIEKLGCEVNRLRERIIRSDERMTELDSEKFVLEKHRETLEHELKELKAQHEQMLSNMSMQAPTSHDNIETISPAADVPSDLERKLLDLQIAFDERESTISALREEIKTRDASLKMFKKVGTRNTCDQCTKNNEKYAEIKKRYESVVDSMIRLDSGMQDVRDDYESRLIAVKVAKKILEKKLKSVQHEFDRINDELRTVLGLVLESTVNNNESRFSVFGPGCLSENRSGIQFVCERLRKQRQALANAQLDCKVIESQKDDALTQLNSITAEMRILKEETNNLKALISEKESCNENLNKLMDEIAGLKDNKARITIFQKQKNEKHQVELELYELKRKCKCGASQ